MPPRDFPHAAFSFYASLAADNSRAFWQAHREVYEQAVRQPMAELLSALGAEFGGRPALFRPQRDTRFSADKAPYKTHQGGFLELAPGTGYHVQVDASGLLVSGGFHAQGADQTAAYRAAVSDTRPGAQLAAITAVLCRDGFTLAGDQVRTRPRGIAIDHPRLDLARRRWLVGERRHSPADMAERTADEVVRADWAALRPLVEWVIAECPPAPGG
jgi:uncharacterized protein (TIGR02453 family)